MYNSLSLSLSLSVYIYIYIYKNGTENAKALGVLGFTGRIAAPRPEGLNSGASIGSGYSAEGGAVGGGCSGWG